MCPSQNAYSGWHAGAVVRGDTGDDVGFLQVLQETISLWKPYFTFLEWSLFLDDKNPKQPVIIAFKKRFHFLQMFLRCLDFEADVLFK